MDELLEYYLTGGEIRIGKKELTLELLRKDSILRVLLGFGAGNLDSLRSKFVLSERQGYVAIDLNWHGKLKFGEDPTDMLNGLKTRYGCGVGGKLSFQCVYTTFEQVFYYYADLDADKVALEPVK